MLLSDDDLLNGNLYVVVRLSGNWISATGYQNVGLRPISLDCSGLDRSDLNDCVHFSGVRTDHHARAVCQLKFLSVFGRDKTFRRMLDGRAGLEH